MGRTLRKEASTMFQKSFKNTQENGRSPRISGGVTLMDISGYFSYFNAFNNPNWDFRQVTQRFEK